MRARLAAAAIAVTLALAPAHARAEEASLAWVDASSSPRAGAVSGLGELDQELLARCGTPEEGLMSVARRVVAAKAAGQPTPDVDGLVLAMRAAGEPHVWPRAWVVSAEAFERDATKKRLDLWRQSFGDGGERRCGLARIAVPGGQVMAAIAVDALADMSPLPVKARTGQWLELDARMRVPATSAKVVLVGPGGAPRTVPTSFQDGRVRARFALDRPGAFDVQVLADVAAGPRPVLEARVYADVEPPRTAPKTSAPGEDAAAGLTGAPALAAMIDAVRRERSLPALTRDARLDALALAHARRMREVRTVAHDVGDGDPGQRVQNAGLSAKEAGENVAHSESVRLAHRSLWQSPSHRANLERVQFTHMGVAVVDDPDGTVWVCEIFATNLR